MKKALSLLTLLVVVGFSATGHSADKYVSAHGGMVWFNDSDVNYGLNSEAFGVDMKAGIDQGITALGAFGCDYGAFRVEGEIGYQGADFESLTVGGPMIEDLVDIVGSADFWDEVIPGPGPFFGGEDLIDFNGPDFNLTMEGDLDVYTLMANGYYDIDLGSGVELYLSAGAGVAQIESSNLQLMVTPGDIISDIDGELLGRLRDIGEDIGGHIDYILGPGEDMILALLDNVEPDAIGLNVSETTLAYQLGAGIGIPVADNIMLDLKYRYFATLDFTVDVDLGVGAGVGVGRIIQGELMNGHPPVVVGGGLGVTADTGFNTSITNHSALAGLRIMF